MENSFRVYNVLGQPHFFLLIVFFFRSFLVCAVLNVNKHVNHKFFFSYGGRRLICVIQMRRVLSTRPHHTPFVAIMFIVQKPNPTSLYLNKQCCSTAVDGKHKFHHLRRRWNQPYYHTKIQIIEITNSNWYSKIRFAPTAIDFLLTAFEPCIWSRPVHAALRHGVWLLNSIQVFGNYNWCAFDTFET